MSVTEHAESNQPAETEDHDAGMRPTRPSLQSLLQEAGVASEKDLRSAFEEAQRRGKSLGEVVLARGWLDQEGLARLLARQWSLPFLGRESLGVDPHAAGLLTAEQARALGGCVIDIRNGGPLVVLAEPTTGRMGDLKAVLGETAHFAVVTESSLQGLIEQRARVGGIPITAPSPAGTEQPEGDEPEAQADVQVDQNQPGEQGEQAGPELDDEQTDALVAELEQATAGLSAARNRIEQLAGARRSAEHLVEDLQRRLTDLEQERTKEQERSRDLESRLDTERGRAGDFKKRLAELLSEFES
jgi:hypothetical protein